MAEKTEIAWCDSTWSPWEGCQKVGPGCDHCYAEGMNRWLRKGENWGPGAPRRAYGDEHWEKPLRWNKLAKAEGVRRRVFPSVCDPFDSAVVPEWRARFFDLIGRTPYLDWLLLTKRIGNAAKMLPWTPEGGKNSLMASSAVWPNVWLGATIVNQEEADRDIPKLLATPAAVRFLSMEPLLGPVDLRDLMHPDGSGTFDALHPAGPQLHWIIVGGESGPHARPMHPDWARSLRDQCATARVPFHFKQWGEWTPGENVERVRGTVDTAFLFDDEWTIHPLNLATDDGHIDDQPDLYRVGKKAAGRLLDGVTHDGYPAGVDLPDGGQAMNDREMLRQVTRALEDLSFECFGGIGTTPPSVDTYNRTFGVLENARDYISVTEPASGVPVVVAANPSLDQGPCTVCGKLWRDHGTYPVYESHNYTPASGAKGPEHG